MSCRLHEWNYAFYVHEVTHANEAPRIEFHDLRLGHSPGMADVSATRARGGHDDDGVERIQLYWLYGTIHLPDLARQFHWIVNRPDAAPCQRHLAPGVGLGSLIDIFSLQDVIGRQFRAPGLSVD